MNDFLGTEYQECLALIKYYDERYHALVKFAAGLSSSVPSVLLALYGLGGAAAERFWTFAALVAGVGLLGLLSIYVVLVQVRLYFVYPARQVNAIRKFALEKEAPEFRDNQMYLDTSLRAFKWRSTHTLLNAFVALQIGVLAGLCLFGILDGVAYTCRLWWSCAFGLSFSTITFFASALYLHRVGSSHADAAINGRRVRT